MFTGIVEEVGEVVSARTEGGNVHFDIRAGICDELKVDQSVAHNGVCLTVVEFPSEGIYRVTAIEETLQRSNLRDWKAGSVVNLERCMAVGDRLDGHIVQGHVDTVGVLESITDRNGSKVLEISHPKGENFLTVAKGSVCVNGTSLTVIESKADRFTVAVIPYTWEHTSFRTLKEGLLVNLEFDILGKYLNKLMEMKGL